MYRFHRMADLASVPENHGSRHNSRKAETITNCASFQKGHKADIKNYRVVSIGSTLLRIFERAVNFKLTSIIEPRLSNAQHGFRPRRSITTNLLNLSVAVHKGFERGNQTDVFY